MICPHKICPRVMRRRRNSQSGYAMLLVFSMSAIVAITLYQQLPRAAFEAQREKESLAINHGEQYRRAVQLYCRKMGRYPAKMEDLDNTQNIRFLRKHYFDPFTGKEEWRLLHMGPNGKLIDSKIEAEDPNKDQWHAGSITEFKSAASSSDGGGPEAVNLASRHRPSDDTTLGPMGGNPPVSQSPDPNVVNSTPNPNPGAPGAPGTPGAPGMPGAPNGPGSPTWTPPGMPPGMRGFQPGNPNGMPPGGNSSAGAGSSISGNGGFGSSVSGNGGFGNPTPTGSGMPGTPPAGGYPVNSQYQGQSPYPTPPGNNQGYNPGFQQGGYQQGQPSPYPTAPGSNQQQQALAVNTINQLLTSPRPGGMPTGIMGNGGAAMIPGGLAGVASTFKGRGIKRYNDQDEYQKWEFYYDYGGEMAGNLRGGVTPQTLNPSTGNGAFGSASPFQTPTQGGLQNPSPGGGFNNTNTLPPTGPQPGR